MRTLTTLPIALTLATLSTPSWAFAPTDAGIEPARVFHYDAARQIELRQQPAWVEFQQGEGQGWQARFDPVTGTPHRMWGPPVRMGATRGEVVANLTAFLARNARVIGATFDGRDGLRLRSANHDAATDTWYVEYDRMVGGAPIWRGGVTARVRHGNLILVGVDTYPNAKATNTPILGRERAIETATHEGPARHAKHEQTAATPLVLPEEVDGRVTLRHVWWVRSTTGRPAGHANDPVGKWSTLVDAQTGAIVTWWNDVRFGSGVVAGLVHARTAADPLVSAVMPYVRVRGGGATVFADAYGYYDVEADSDEYSAGLFGEFARVNNDAGAEGELTWTGGGDVTWTAEDATQAEIDTYKFLHDARAWGATVIPDNEWIADRVTANVNLNDICNAYFDGSTVNFFRAGSGSGYSCRNTGEMADVVYHEWGHGLHMFSLKAGSFDGSLSEGAADTVSTYQTGDYRIAPDFFTSGEPIREVSTDKAYPRDFNTAGDVHSNGLIFGGAMWDLWEILKADVGEDAARPTVISIFTGLLKAGPDIEGSFDEAVVADDDNGNLADGTPHYCDIVAAFAPHGLGPIGGGASPVSVVVTDQPASPPPAPVRVSATIFDRANGCYPLTPTNARVAYRVDGGDWQTAAAVISGDDISGDIPAFPEGSFVEWFVEVDSDDGTTTTGPEVGEIAPYSYYVGGVLPLFCTDFEADTAGFTHELVAGQESLGADDWQWGKPMGEAGDPAEAASGTHAWGNDLGDGDYNGEYQGEKFNRLLSPAIATDWYQGVFLSYQRWLTVEDGYYDHARITADGATVWSNWASGEDGADHTRDKQWMAHVVPLDGAGDDGTVQVAWEIESDQGLHFGGWNVDDVCVFAPATPDNRLAIVDFVASDNSVGAVTLTWTNPRHAPLVRVVVVRKDGSFPTGPTDGAVVFDDAAPAVEAAMSATDATATPGVEGFYAVYASDGTDWLSTPVEGKNADRGSLNGDGPEVAPGGCACDARSGAAGWAVVPLALAALLRRRSKQTR
jgi:MYXO-CTERM domain-containing protein